MPATARPATGTLRQLSKPSRKRPESNVKHNPQASMLVGQHTIKPFCNHSGPSIHKLSCQIPEPRSRRREARLDCLRASSPRAPLARKPLVCFFALSLPLDSALVLCSPLGQRLPHAKALHRLHVKHPPDHFPALSSQSFRPHVHWWHGHAKVADHAQHRVSIATIDMKQPEG